jgi:holin-like protein
MPTSLLNGFTLLLLFQLMGEFLVFTTGIPVPGPVIGMALLFFSLLLRRGLLAVLDGAASALLGHLSLLFVPAGVGVMVHFDKLVGDGLAIAVALMLSTLITLGVTAVLMQIGIRLQQRWRGEE